MIPPALSTLFPYTTLFRSGGAPAHGQHYQDHDLYPGAGGNSGSGKDSDRGLPRGRFPAGSAAGGDRKSTRLNSSHVSISYAVFCLKKKKTVKRRYKNPIQR